MPIYKNGNKEEPLNYRPVSLTGIVCEICEEVIKKQWPENLEREEIITNIQFGFRTGRSCVTNLLSFYSRVIDITQERDRWADCMYLDLKKTFDKVPHRRLHTMKVGTHWRIERNDKELNGRLPKTKGVREQ